MTMMMTRRRRRRRRKTTIAQIQMANITMANITLTLNIQMVIFMIRSWPPKNAKFIEK
jgi:hypothetical protein